MILAMLALVIATVLYGGATTVQAGCSDTLTSLSPCLNYLNGGSTSPSSNCCSQFSTVVQSSPECLCYVVNSNESSFSGFKFNRTLALNLPTACNVQTPSPSQCNTSRNVPTTSPVNTPVASPVGSPQSAPSPSGTTSPANTPSGSKKFAGSNESSSNSNVIILSFVSIALVLATI
ncbi:Bifunctional inhibitor/plant lipid transfer protein/seed storage helical domain [Arabidopsis thaliana x Arabidopsis arenosa]|uniref:Bifunctional inhibitor/plant lipid transfer protein/seed storage helical domain n=1 Tax=Arabidopsis thaliana x Arabidopsis arenosa TaxID=1240361 RepID=A0A8T1ZG03_9BRAS|nr:Bifunctional inhibitor/plant lipid transfer protein/seed storage helical domain [Arabidopsis thaliana x Arabidopsis arenosa]